MTDATVAPWFGAGADEPYEHALRTASGGLELRDAATAGTGSLVDLARYLADPAPAERRLVLACAGPVLDVGCGPGRMLRAALLVGHTALGVDVSAASIDIATARGLPVAHLSVFDDAVPGAGEWGTILLLDGNIGIGGDPPALLARCAQLLRPGGQVIVETHRRRSHDRRFHAVLVDRAGATSLPFPWAEVGAQSLLRHARTAGLAPGGRHRAGRRRFHSLVRG